MQNPLVLIVEDDRQAREGYAEFLERGGFRVIEAPDAHAALHTSVERRPQVVITDVALPGMDGFTLATRLRVDVRTRGIPIIAMTGHWSTDVRHNAEQAGIRAVLLKPCLPDHLLAEVRRVLRAA